MTASTFNEIEFRTASLDDLRSIIELLADDPLGALRESCDSKDYHLYEKAMGDILEQKGNEILLAVQGQLVVGVIQLTLIPGLARLGMLRAQIEGVRVASTHRNHGIGESLIKCAIDKARTAGCGIVQLTTDKRRADAKRFYERIGFVASHEGMKYEIR